jgi:hypothetical protein
VLGAERLLGGGGVDQVDAVFAVGNPPQPIDLSMLTLLNDAVPWAPGPWIVDEAGTEQLTPDLGNLLQAIVKKLKGTSAHRTKTGKCGVVEGKSTVNTKLSNVIIIRGFRSDQKMPRDMLR